MSSPVLTVGYWRKESLPSCPPLARVGRACKACERKVWTGTLSDGWVFQRTGMNQYLEGGIGGEKTEKLMRGSEGASTQSYSKGLYHVRRSSYLLDPSSAQTPNSPWVPWGAMWCIIIPGNISASFSIKGSTSSCNRAAGAPVPPHWSLAQEATDLHVCNSPTLRPYGSSLWWLLLHHRGGKPPSS